MSRRLRLVDRALSCLTATAWVLLSAAPASAQRLAFGVTSSAASTFTVVDLATGTSTPATDDQAQLGAVFTSDGQYAVRVVMPGLLSVRHMPSGQHVAVASFFQPSVAHPRRHTIFGAVRGFGTGLARFDERGLVVWEACGPLDATPPMDLSAGGYSLYALCPNGDLVAIDTESGAEVRRLPAVGASGLALNAAATEAVVLRRGVNGWFDLNRLDLATGQTIATRPIYSLRGTTLVPTPDHTRLLLTISLPVGAEVLSLTTLVDAVTLEDVLGLASSWRLAVPSAVVSPDGHDAFAVSRGPGSGQSAVWMDIGTGSIRAATSVGDGYALALGYAPAPLPPVLEARVGGGSVTLSWALLDRSPMVTGYRVDVGTAPGLANLGSFTVGAESFAAAGVPRGRYYVRVRAVNVNGTSPPSNERIVDVP